MTAVSSELIEGVEERAVIAANAAATADNLRIGRLIRGNPFLYRSYSFISDRISDTKIKTDGVNELLLINVPERESAVNPAIPDRKKDIEYAVPGRLS